MEEQQKIFDCLCIINYSDITAAANNGKLTINGNPRPTLGGLYTIPKCPEGNTISQPTNYNQQLHTEIGYGDCVVLGGHWYVLTLVDCDTNYVWTYRTSTLSGANVIHYLQ